MFLAQAKEKTKFLLYKSDQSHQRVKPYYQCCCNNSPKRNQESPLAIKGRDFVFKKFYFPWSTKRKERGRYLPVIIIASIYFDRCKTQVFTECTWAQPRRLLHSPVKKMSYAMRRILGKFRKEPEDMWLTVQVSQVVLLSPDVIAVDESIWAGEIRGGSRVKLAICKKGLRVRLLSRFDIFFFRVPTMWAIDEFLSGQINLWYAHTHQSIAGNLMSEMR